MIFDLLVRLVIAYRVYRKRKCFNSKVISFELFLDVLDSLFNELLTLMFSKIRIINRREASAYIMSQVKRKINIELLAVQVLNILFVTTTLILFLLNFNFQYIDKFK